MIDISVGIPAFNESRNLGALLGDLLAQHCDDSTLEIIVVDDASTDKTVSIAETFALQDPRVRIIRHASRMGSTAAWNSIFSAARGEICVKLDGDVRVVDRMFLSKLFNEMRRTGHMLAFCSVVPRERPASFTECGTAFIYNYLAEQNRMGLSTTASLFTAMMAATRSFYNGYRIPPEIIANDYYTARYADRSGLKVLTMSELFITVRTAVTLNDFRKQAQRFSLSHRQINEIFGRPSTSMFSSAPAIVRSALRDPRGFLSFLLLRREIRDGATSPAWEQVDSTK